MITVTLSSLDPLTRTEKLLSEHRVFIGAALNAGGLQLVGVLKTPPPARRITRASVYGKTFVSDKQRKFVMASIRNGTIQVPYTRESGPSSRRLLASWSVRAADGGMSVIVGNPTTYGPLVMGPNQSLFMQAMGWEKAQDIAREQAPLVNAAIAANVKAYLAARR